MYAIFVGGTFFILFIDKLFPYIYLPNSLYLIRLHYTSKTKFLFILLIRVKKKVKKKKVKKAHQANAYIVLLKLRKNIISDC
jgi:hypothetical protein